MVRIHSTIESIATRSTALAACSRSDEAQRKGRFVSKQVADEPTLTIDSDPRQPGSDCVSVHNLHPYLITSLGKHPEAGRLLQSILRVRVIDAGMPGGEDIPDVFGRHQVLENGIRFIPHFPFDSGIRFRATFDPQPLGRPELSQALTLEFSLPKAMNAMRTEVKHVFPSSDSLPENLLRFYVCFFNPMRRGRAEEQIGLLGPDGWSAPDTLYRPPVKLWDKSMRHLTILLDPGRLKRGVGPNRELGPPLKPGQKYGVSLLRGRAKKTQPIGSATRALLRGLSGHRYQLSYNTFHRTGAVDYATKLARAGPRERPLWRRLRLRQRGLPLPRTVDRSCPGVSNLFLRNGFFLRPPKLSRATV